MTQIRKAVLTDTEGICRVCSAGWRDTYRHLYPEDYIERVIAEFYNLERIRSEIMYPDGWDGWLVADKDGIIVGAGGGGMTGATTGEIFVLYLDPNWRGRGIGTALLDVITQQQKEHGAREQWVSVGKDNQKGIPFYEARGFVCKGERPSYGNNPEEEFISLRYWRPL